MKIICSKRRRQIKPIDSDDLQSVYTFTDTNPEPRSRKTILQEIIDKDLENIVNNKPGMIIIDSWEG